VSAGLFETVSLTHARFSLEADDVTADFGMTTGAFDRCHPCAAGVTVPLSTYLFVTNDAGGSATVRGVRYDNVPMSPVRIEMTADAVIVPNTGEQVLTFVEPFTYVGSVRGVIAPFLDMGAPDTLFSVPLTGAGKVTLELFSCDGCILPDGRRFYDRRRLEYSFEQQP
jgi:hypothetical protein